MRKSQDEPLMGTPIASSAPERVRRTARVQGHLLPLARVAWLALVLLVFFLMLVIVPVEFDRLQHLCLGPACTDPHLTPHAAQTLQQMHLPLVAYAAYFVALKLGIVLVYGAVGAIIIVRGSTERVALLAAFVLVAYSEASMADPGMINQLAATHPIDRWLASAIDVTGIVSLGFFLSIFPDGHFVPRWTAALSIAWGALLAPQYLAPESPLNIETWPAFLQLPVWLGLLGGMAATQLYRYRTVSSPAHRQQTKWVVFGVSLTLFTLVTLIVTDTILPLSAQYGLWPSLVENTAWYLSMALVPLSLGIAILRHRLWDIDLLINRTLVYGALTVSILGFYLLIVGGLGAVLQARGSIALSLLTTGLVAVLFAPLRDRLQRGINRLMYGERDEPYAVLSRLGQRLEATLEPKAVLPAVVETVAQALKLPYVAIALKDSGGRDAFNFVAAWGSPVELLVRLPLIYQYETVGQLLLAPRSPGEAFGPADLRLLDDLARQAGVAAHAVLLTADLQRARERLVSTREEERRRLRRDLHDGLGPQLSSQTLTIDAVRMLMRRDPDAAEELLLDLKAQTQAAVSDIRRLVYGLRPPALDDLGLVGGLREGAARQGADGLGITVEAPEELPPLPAAVEVAAYRIAQEAVTNVVRHAGAESCTVSLAIDEEAEALCLEVRDDGKGVEEEHKAGVGLSSMRERAAELGGNLMVEALRGGGTRVRARLPLEEG